MTLVCLVCFGTADAEVVAGMEFVVAEDAQPLSAIAAAATITRRRRRAARRVVIAPTTPSRVHQVAAGLVNGRQSGVWGRDPDGRRPTWPGSPSATMPLPFRGVPG